MALVIDQVRLHLNFVFFGIIGFLARIGLIRLTVHQGILGGVLWANCAGCLVMGFLVRFPFYTASSSVKVLSSKSKYYKSKTEVPLYIGLTTGFCGTVTSLSSFILELFQLSSNTTIVDFAYPNPGWGVTTWFAYVFITLCVSAGSFIVGRHIAEMLIDNSRTSFSPSLIHLIQDVISVLGFLAWITVITLSILSSFSSITGNSQISGTWRYWCLGMSFSPIAVFLRYWLSRFLNPLYWPSKFMLGTFSCNVLAVIVLAVFSILQFGGGGTAISTKLHCDVVRALADGFCGTLSTVSTLIAELFALRREFFLLTFSSS